MQKVIKNEVYNDNKNSKYKLFNSCKGNINKIWKQAKTSFSNKNLIFQKN